MADLYTRAASSRVPRPQLWLNVALAVGLVVVAWILFVAGLLAGFDETTFVLAMGGLVTRGRSVRLADVSHRRTCPETGVPAVPALTVAALVIGWMGALLT